MIASFGDRATEDLYHGRLTARARRFPGDVVEAALVKMDSLNGASSTLDPRSPPDNRLEALEGELKSRHSIRATSGG
jgi:toxin HigB-1